MIVYNHKVFDGPITGTAAVYTPSELSAELARAARWFVSVRASQGSGSDRKITIWLEHSNDDVNWAEYDTQLVADQPYSDTAVTVVSGSNRGTAVVPGSYVRLRVTLGGTTTPSGNFEVWLCGRDDL